MASYPEISIDLGPGEGSFKFPKPKEESND